MARAAGPRPPTPPAAEAGVALLIVLVVLFIVAVLMADISLTATTARRSAHNASTEFLMNAAVDRKFHVGLAQVRYEDRANHGFTTLDDRWALADFTNDEKDLAAEGETPAAPAAPEDEEAGAEGVTVYGEGGKGSVKAELGRHWDPEPDPEEPENDPGDATPIEDEDRKFNLYLLIHDNPEIRKRAHERFDVLLDQYRQGTPLDITRAKAEEMREKIFDYLNRQAVTEGLDTGIPIRRDAKDRWWILTPDEIANAEGLEGILPHGLSARGILHDAQDPKAAAEYRENLEGEEPPAYPGLLRYITVWSGDAFKGNRSADSKFPINLNTAPRPVLAALFYMEEPNFDIVKKIVEYRREEEEEGTGSTTTASAGEDEPLARHKHFEKFPDDLSKVEGFQAEMLGDKRNNITTDFLAGVKSTHFSLFIKATREREVVEEEDEEEGSKRQPAEVTKLFRFVVRREEPWDKDLGLYRYWTILREERDDPGFARAEKDALK